MAKLSSAFIGDPLTSVQHVPAPRAAATAAVRGQQLRRMSVRMDHSAKEKVVVVIGSTGTGKSRLAVDIARRFPAEIINSDKLQVYNCLPISANLTPVAERGGVPHHLLAELNPFDGEYTASYYRYDGANAVTEITSRNRLPVVVGCSMSFVHAILADRFEPEPKPVFSGSGLMHSGLRYDCCFLWLDVQFPVLFDILRKRIDEMLDAGMFEELADFYNLKKSPGTHVELSKTMGVPEFERYFRNFSPVINGNKTGRFGDSEWDQEQREAFEKAVVDTKQNTCDLAKRQVDKIVHLKNAGLDLKRLDATAAFSKKLTAKTEKDWSESWEKDVLEPSLKIVKEFLN